MGFEEDVQRFMLGLLAMNDTVPKLPLDLLGQRLAVGHGALNREGQRTALPPYEPRAMNAAMGYSSTLNDLAQLARWQLRLLARGGSELLKVSTLREMQRVQWQDADGSRTMGLGFLVNRDGAHTMRLAPAKDPAQFAAYTGRYVDSPWSSESVIVPWGEGLAALEMPSTEWIFQRDGSGRVAGVSVNGQFTARSGPLP